MLSREVMGALALAILWVNALLIAAAAVKAAIGVARRGRELGTVSRAEVVGGDGEGGALAELVIDQVGRLAAGPEPRILFHDRAHAARVFGGRVRLEGTDGAVDGGGEKELVATDNADVWIDPARLAAAAGRASEGAFEEACVEAKKARGFSRKMSAPIAAGDEVWVGVDERGRTTLVSTLDPRPWVACKVALAYAFVWGELLVAGACTAVALTPPVFGAVSTAGAAAGLVFFLLVQPVGTAVRDALRPPSQASRQDHWTRPARLEQPRAEAAPSAASGSPN